MYVDGSLVKSGASVTPDWRLRHDAMVAAAIGAAEGPAWLSGVRIHAASLPPSDVAAAAKCGPPRRAMPVVAAHVAQPTAFKLNELRLPLRHAHRACGSEGPGMGEDGLTLVARLAADGANGYGCTKSMGSTGCGIVGTYGWLQTSPSSHHAGVGLSVTSNGQVKVTFVQYGKAAAVVQTSLADDALAMDHSVHIAAVVAFPTPNERANVTLYVNGAGRAFSAGPAGGAAVLSTLPTVAVIGGAGGERYLDGTLSDVRVYAAALTDDDIAALAGPQDEVAPTVVTSFTTQPEVRLAPSRPRRRGCVHSRACLLAAGPPASPQLDRAAADRHVPPFVAAQPRPLLGRCLDRYSRRRQTLSSSPSSRPHRRGPCCRRRTRCPWTTKCLHSWSSRAAACRSRTRRRST